MLLIARCSKPTHRNPAYSRLLGQPTRGRKRRWPRILLWTFVSLLVLLVAVVVAGVFWLRSAEKAALPVLDGELHVAGLSAPVTVRRDAHGVPHIDAATQDDLFIAQGYVTAQDRLWQMDALRRNANGELAEVMGPSLVRHDKAQRVPNAHFSAADLCQSFSIRTCALLDDYARGRGIFSSRSTRTPSSGVSTAALNRHSRGLARTRSALARR